MSRSQQDAWRFTFVSMSDVEYRSCRRWHFVVDLSGLGPYTCYLDYATIMSMYVTTQELAPPRNESRCKHVPNGSSSAGGQWDRSLFLLSVYIPISPVSETTRAAERQFHKLSVSSIWKRAYGLVIGLTRMCVCIAVRNTKKFKIWSQNKDWVLNVL